MNNGSEAAEQVVRMSLEGFEVVAKLTGAASLEIANKIVAVVKQEHKTKGRSYLTSMLKSGKEMRVYTLQQKDIAMFKKHAKKYGILYCVLKDNKNKDPNAEVDIIARAEDVSKINRIIERFSMNGVEAAEIQTEVKREKANPNLSLSEKESPSEKKSENKRSNRFVQRKLQKIKETMDAEKATGEVIKTIAGKER